MVGDVLPRFMLFSEFGKGWGEQFCWEGSISRSMRDARGPVNEVEADCDEGSEFDVGSIVAMKQRSSALQL